MGANILRSAFYDIILLINTFPATSVRVFECALINRTAADELVAFTIENIAVLPHRSRIDLYLVIMWNGGRLPSSIVQDVRTQNVTAATAIANIVKSSLGPVGLDKMLVDEVKGI